MDKNVITRIETNKRYVTDVELKALKEVFQVSYDYLIEGKKKHNLKLVHKESVSCVFAQKTSLHALFLTILL